MSSRALYPFPALYGRHIAATLRYTAVKSWLNLQDKKKAGAPDIGPRLRMKEPSWV